VVTLKDIIITQNSAQQKFAALARVDLDLKPVRNTQELIRLVPGLLVAQHAGGGKAEQIFLRGFDCDHGTDIAVSVDGLPINMVHMLTDKVMQIRILLFPKRLITLIMAPALIILNMAIYVLQDM
jgi:outer membrane cobalamin receptor